MQKSRGSVPGFSACKAGSGSVSLHSPDAKPVHHRKFLVQKINYIHLNPVRGKWKLLEHWEDYEHSTAKFYVKNICNGFVPVHYEELN